MSSTNVLADRRLQYARMFHERRDFEAAESLCLEAIDIAPDWEAAHFQLGEVREAAGNMEGAADAYARYIALADSDSRGAEVRLALLGRAPVPETLPPSYVEALFDDYAERFDRSLLDRLDYRAPMQLRDLYDRSVPDDGRLLRVLDLGCGTGLGGEAFRERAGWLRGVDLSEKMLAAARRKGHYDDLARADVTAGCAAGEEAYDLVLAADVLVYIGDLEPVFRAVLAALRPGGCFAFSVQYGRGADFELLRQCRYGHDRGYLVRLAAETGFELHAIEDAACRREAGEPVPGAIVLLRRPVAVTVTELETLPDAPLPLRPVN